MDDEQTTEIEDAEGHGFRMKVEPAEDDDTEGALRKRGGVEPAEGADTEGHRIKRG